MELGRTLAFLDHNLRQLNAVEVADLSYEQMLLACPA